MGASHGERGPTCKKIRHQSERPHHSAAIEAMKKMGITLMFLCILLITRAKHIHHVHSRMRNFPPFQIDLDPAQADAARLQQILCEQVIKRPGFNQSIIQRSCFPRSSFIWIVANLKKRACVISHFVSLQCCTRASTLQPFE